MYASEPLATASQNHIPTMRTASKDKKVTVVLKRIPQRGNSSARAEMTNKNTKQSYLKTVQTIYQK